MLPTFEGDSLAERRFLAPTPQGGSREQLQSVIGIGGAARAMANTAIRSLEGYGVSVVIFVFRFCAPVLKTSLATLCAPLGSHHRARC